MYAFVMDDDGVGSLVLTTVGAIVVLVALFLPLFTVHYSPPGGSAVVYGHRIYAFTETITGWQFANAAQWTHLLWVAGIFALPIAVMVFTALELEAGKLVSKLTHSLMHVVVALGWLLLLGIGLVENYLTMPYAGEKGILPEFQESPFTPGYQASLPPGGPTPHLSASFGVGWFVLLAGILLGILGLWRLVIAVLIFAILSLILTHIFSHAVYNWIVTWIL
jgi:hypothetical protein